jgi:hypothetical protein
VVIPTKSVNLFADLEVKAGDFFVQQQISLEGLERARQYLFEQNVFRMSEGSHAITAMEQQREELRQATTEGSGIAKAKVKASLTLLEKRIRFAQFYLQSFQERFKRLESAIEVRRVELSGKK